MKLSILIYNDKPNKLNNLLETIFQDYNSSDTEVIIIDSYSKNIDSVISLYSEKIEDGNLKVIFTDVNRRVQAFLSAVRTVEGEYTAFLSSSSTIKKGYIEKTLITIEAINPDIIETDISFQGTVNLKYSAPEELARNLTYDAKKTYSLSGYISPFLSNKVIKTEFIKYMNSLESMSNDEFAFIYSMLFHADTYIYINNPGLKITVTEKVDTSDKLKQWDYIIKYYKRYSDWELTKASIEYAYVRYVTLFSSKIVSKERINKQDRKWDAIVQERISQEFPNWKHNRLIKTDAKLQRALEVTDISIQAKNISKTKKTTIHIGRSIKTSIKAPFKSLGK